MATQFYDAIPAVPHNYFRLSLALTSDERKQAYAFGYLLSPEGILATGYTDLIRFDVWSSDPDIANWRNRMFLVWFCYLYENFYEIEGILGAFEGLILEFQGGPDLFYEKHFDDLDNNFVSDYAGIGATEPLGEERMRFEYNRLEPHYYWAQKILADHKPNDDD